MNPYLVTPHRVAPLRFSLFLLFDVCNNEVM